MFHCKRSNTRSSNSSRKSIIIKAWMKVPRSGTFLLALKRTNLTLKRLNFLGDASLQADFDSCVDLFKSFLEQVVNDSTQTFNVSRVKTAGEGGRMKKSRGPLKVKKWVHKGAKGPGGNSGKRKSHDEIQDRYYTTMGYAQFMQDQRLKLQNLRNSCQGKVSAVNTDLEQLKMQIAKLCTAKDDPGEDDNVQDAQRKEGGNRHNMALQRNRKANN